MNGLTDAELCHMGLQEVVWHMGGAGAANREKWRMVRRICYIIARTMGGYKGTEESLWGIEGDKRTLGNQQDKIKAWRNRLIELGKIKT